MFDTHCHLNFGSFDGHVDEVVDRAVKAGVLYIVVPGTDTVSSQKGVAIASQFEHVYAAVGIHPHHVFELNTKSEQLKDDLTKIEELLQNKKVLAVGEVGVDRHYYKNTKYSDYSITDDFIKLQTELLKEQIGLAVKYRKSLIIHNREAKDDLLGVLYEVWTRELEERTVIHCCEPDKDLLAYAKKYHCFVGVDGDVTYSRKKQEYIKTVPLDMLVLETDAPFLVPEPLRTQKIRPNEPKNISLIAQKVAELQSVPVKRVMDLTTQNAKKLFRIQ